jgi:hypothetical protein
LATGSNFYLIQVLEKEISHMSYFNWKSLLLATSVAASASAFAADSGVSYLTFDGYCDEIQFQQTSGDSGMFYGVNSPASCESGALMFAYVLKGIDGRVHVAIAGGYTNSSGDPAAIKMIDLDINGGFTALGIVRNAADRGATAITGQTSGKWNLSASSRGAAAVAPRSVGKKQPSLLSGL